MSKSMDNYISINKDSWNAKVEPHLKSDFYFVDEFLQGRSSLNSIELDLLGDIRGKKILHLQCHFGQDSISLSRMGAEVTAVDFSDKAIAAAKDMAKQCGTNTRFVLSDVYDLPNVLDEKFDLVYTSYGTIGWLPDLDRWAKVISHFLKPGGRLVFVEFHPIIWMFDDDFTFIKYSYFNEGPIVETNQGTYADRNADIVKQHITWNHPTSEVLTCLVSNGLDLKVYNEYDWSPYGCFPHNEEFEKGKFRIPQLGNKVPYVFSLVAVKNNG